MAFSDMVQIKTIIESSTDKSTKRKDLCLFLQGGVSHYNWVGFYLADNEKRELKLGEYVGAPTDHSTIPFGRGVCGMVAEGKSMKVVQDVSQLQNYLSCSINVKSEIVLPVFKAGVFVAELDIDSHSPSPFTKADESFLSEVCKMISVLF